MTYTKLNDKKNLELWYYEIKLVIGNYFIYKNS